MNEPNRTDFARDLSISYDRLGDVFLARGDSRKAQEYYKKSLETDERLSQLEPHRTDFVRAVAFSCIQIAKCCGSFDTEEGRSWLIRARDILRQLKAENHLPDTEIADYLTNFEENLK